MKRFTVEWSRPASIDLLNIIEYISQDNIDAAMQVFEKIKSKCKTLNQFPEMGRIPPELKAYGIFNYRELVIPPWRVIYRISEQKVFILAVLDSRRDIKDVLIERLV